MKIDLNKLPPKTKIASILSFSITLCFTVFLFVPLDLFMHNPTDFIVSWKFLLPTLLTASFIGIIAISAVLLLLYYKKFTLGIVLFLMAGLIVTFARVVFHRFIELYLYVFPAVAVLILLWIFLFKFCSKYALDIVLLAGWGGIISAYVQMLFLNGKMAAIKGDKQNYGSLSAVNIVNLLIWIIITLLPLCLWWFFKTKKKEFKYEKALIVTMCLIFGMQAAGLVTTSFSVKLPLGYDEDLPLYISYENTVKYSSDENIVVFVLDRLDNIYLTEVLDEYPELSDQLKGFTYYKNNVPEYAANTFPSVTKMLTQHDYNFKKGLTFDEYWQEAWEQKNIIDSLRENGFSTNLYIDRLSTYGDLKQIRNRTDNLKDRFKMKVNPTGMLDSLGRMSVGRLTPYLMKNFFLSSVSPSFANEFFIVNTKNETDLAQPTVGNQSDFDFYNYIKANEISNNSKNKVFNFIHLNCSHADYDKSVFTHGYHFDPAKKMIERGGNYIDSTRACFEILNTYFEKMKDRGVYDNSTIILLGDHGKGSLSTSGLLIKPKHAKKEFSIDGKSQLSTKYFGASILEAAKIPHKRLGPSYFDIIGGSPPPKRKVYEQEGWWAVRETSKKISLKGIYEIPKDANDFENWNFKK